MKQSRDCNGAETIPPPGKPKMVGADASHAWLSLYIPGFDWIDLYSNFVNENGYLRQELTSDGLHLNEAGYRIWSEILYQKGLR